MKHLLQVTLRETLRVVSTPTYSSIASHNGIHCSHVVGAVYHLHNSSFLPPHSCFVLEDRVWDELSSSDVESLTTLGESNEKDAPDVDSDLSAITKELIVGAYSYRSHLYTELDRTPPINIAVTNIEMPTPISITSCASRTIGMLFKLVLVGWKWLYAVVLLL